MLHSGPRMRATVLGGRARGRREAMSRRREQRESGGAGRRAGRDGGHRRGRWTQTADAGGGSRQAGQGQRGSATVRRETSVRDGVGNG